LDKWEWIVVHHYCVLTIVVNKLDKRHGNKEASSRHRTIPPGFDKWHIRTNCNVIRQKRFEPHLNPWCCSSFDCYCCWKMRDNDDNDNVFVARDEVWVSLLLLSSSKRKAPISEWHDINTTQEVKRSFVQGDVAVCEYCKLCTGTTRFQSFLSSVF
jgi:hypothetical protein